MTRKSLFGEQGGFVLLYNSGFVMLKLKYIPFGTGVR